MMSAEIIDAMTPMDSVTPKPLIGPEPRKNNRAAASRVVTLESMIAVHALLKPTASARRRPAEISECACGASAGQRFRGIQDCGNL